MSDHASTPRLDDVAAIVLAAGKGTRMRSRRPKVLHEIAGRPLIGHVLASLAEAGFRRTIVVVGHGAAEVRASLDGQVTFAEQNDQLGTGHAVAQATPLLDDVGEVVVCNGDMPLFRPATFQEVVRRHRAAHAAMTLVAAEIPNPTGYGRVVLDEHGTARSIVEEVAATPEQRAIRLVNCGVYCFDATWLRSALPRLPLTPKGEYYVTDLVAIAVHDGARVEVVNADAAEMDGVNDRVDLARVSAAIRQQILRQHMLNGVTIVDPTTTYVDADVTIGPDTVVQPNTHLVGRTSIGEACVIGPNSEVIESQIGDGTRVWASVVESSRIGNEASIGPFTHLRPGAVVGDRCVIGNYAEIKNAEIGTGTKMRHFGFVGDATIGAHVNIGAGTVTCNFDGETREKSWTIVGDRAQIGSDTMLVAPVEVGTSAVTGAGSVVTHDVPPGTVVRGVPAREVRPRHPAEQEEGPASRS